MDEQVMAAGDAVHDETDAPERPQYLARVGDWKVRAHAAMEIFLTLGAASPGTGNPLSSR